MRTSPGSVVVTGASGTVGRAVADGLIARGRTVRVADRNVDDDVPAVERVRLDFTDPSTFAPALIGAAAEAMVDPQYRCEALHLTGPEAVTFDDVAAELTGLVGRSIEYEPTSVLRYFGHLSRQRLSVMQAVVQTIVHRGLRNGDAEDVTGDVERVLGRPPRTLDEYLADHVDRWQPPTESASSE